MVLFLQTGKALLAARLEKPPEMEELAEQVLLLMVVLEATLLMGLEVLEVVVMQVIYQLLIVLPETCVNILLK